LLAAILSHPRLRFAAFYRSAIFIPTILSFVIVGFSWKLILSPIWGIAPSMLDAVGLKSLFSPWLGKEEYALTALSLISVWQFIGIPMMLIYAALITIPDEILEAGEVDGITGMSAFWKIKLLGTFLYRTFFGFQLQLGDPHMGAAIASAMFATILIGVCIYLFAIQTRFRRYQF